MLLENVTGNDYNLISQNLHYFHRVSYNQVHVYSQNSYNIYSINNHMYLVKVHVYSQNSYNIII